VYTSSYDNQYLKGGFFFHQAKTEIFDQIIFFFKFVLKSILTLKCYDVQYV